jgi:hypothetical protein
MWLALYAAGIAVFWVMFAKAALHDSAPNEGSDYVFGMFIGLVAALLWPLVLVGTFVFLTFVKEDHK